MAAVPHRPKSAKSVGRTTVETSRARLHANARARMPEAVIPAPAIATAPVEPRGLPTLTKLLEQNNEILRRLAAIETLLGKNGAVVDGVYTVVKALYTEFKGAAPDDLEARRTNADFFARVAVDAYQQKQKQKAEAESAASEDVGDEPMATVTSIDAKAKELGGEPA